MLSAFSNSLKIPELRQRIFFTCAMLFLCRLLAVIPLPGVSVSVLQTAVDNMTANAGDTMGFFGLLDLFSGGALTGAAVGALGIMPSISASIILQLMTAVVPSLERLAREGDAGRQKIIQYGRYLTVALCIVQGFGFAAVLYNGLGLPNIEPGQLVLMEHKLPFLLLAVLGMTTGTMLLMWFGEQITARGIGNGISLIITVSIVSRLPGALAGVGRMFRTHQANIFTLIVLVVLAFLVVAGVVAVTQAQRKIPVQYAKRVVGRKTYGGQSTYMPLRVNYSGVMPIIFASAILMFVGKALEFIPWTHAFAIENLRRGDSVIYLVFYGLMILFFSYFWVATQFHPVQIADDLKKYGGYVPGIRPGKPTAEFLDKTMTRITLSGAVFLTVIAILPIALGSIMKIDYLVAQFFGGTSLLIIVGVMLDTMRQVESHLVTRHYDGFLRKGHLRSRR